MCLVIQLFCRPLMFDFQIISNITHCLKSILLVILGPYNINANMLVSRQPTHLGVLYLFSPIDGLHLHERFHGC